ncbi:MAG: redoxin domain-containing protein [Pseudobacter sp.]|uniref:redoxin domain-containing protein n=1 Tax=Pseudobacter sp. TaxID=2045420 RepID=UPI003F80A2DC
MKNILLVCVATFSLPALNAQQKFQVKAKISNIAYPAKAYISYNNGEQIQTDSVVVEKGKFTFKGTILNPSEATITLKQSDGNTDMYTRDLLDLYLEKGKISIRGDKQVKSATVKGAGVAQADFDRFNAIMKPLRDKMAPLSIKMRQYYNEKNDAAKDSIFPQLVAIRKDLTALETEFIKNNPGSWVTLGMMKHRAVIIDVPEFEPLFIAMTDELKNTADGRRIADRLVIAKRLQPGQPFINFVLNDTEGRPVSLESFKGKYVLVDFWASWCGPCRAENPHVLKAYNQFKDKNFDVLAISLDQKKDAWLKAIREDGMPWTHVSDLKGFDNVAAKEYGIIAIPQNFLLDPQGKIIAQNLRGENLAKKLAEILP